MRKSWKSYSKEFKKKAIESGFTDPEISFWLTYAKQLYEKNLPIIFDQIHYSLLVGYNYEYLKKITNDQRKFYQEYEIPKKKGGTRFIAEPLPSLKEIQKWTLVNILENVKVSKFAKAYIKNKSIRVNAWFHKNQDIVLRIDVEDFFGSIKFHHVYDIYKRLGYSKQVSTLLTKLCIKDGKLPQGSPTSPTLSNIYMFYADKRISSFVVPKKVRYTRYADDLIFSGNFDPGLIIKFVQLVLKDYDLNINTTKTRVLKKHQRQLVTGIVVNEKLQVPRETRKKLRQAVYYINKFGLDSHLEHTENLHANHIRHLLGIANFILYVNPEDKYAKQYIEILLKYL